MDKLQWKREKTLTEPNSIKLFEQEKGFSVPTELKELVKKHNGGRPSPNEINTVDGTELEVKGLLSFNKEDVENIYDVVDYFKGNFNNTLLPFATESGGNFYCINLTNNSIIFWEHETNEQIPVARNLKDFLSRLAK
ncbi:SMI1/KNR4 family protein [Evansella sp. AB-rgal1]|uniref:SMI1/KNR4 family protein n=1 Tax=Evansella sp. AB-rgal1 TaxID=3242696 RepID=UPI00359EE2D5